MMEKYAIIGFGCAGYSAAKALRDSGFTGGVDVYDAAGGAPANPMLTTYFASGKISEEQLHPFGTQAEIARALSLTIYQSHVKRVLPDRRSVVLDDGSSKAYDKLLLTTGARAFVPPLTGLPSSKVLTMRTPADAEALKSLLVNSPVKTAVVVGASMVGVKVAELLLEHGVDITMADAAPYLFPLAAFEDAAREMEKRMEARGLHFKWNCSISGICAGGARFSDGTSLPADLVCLCIGTRANTDLVEQSADPEHPLRIHRGIVVNGRMETNLPGVYAAGDCCEGTNLQTGDTMIIGLWANAAAQGSTAGVNMAGGHAEFSGSIPHNITHFMGMDFIGLGDPRLPGQHFTFLAPGSHARIHATVADGTLLCVNIIDAHQVSGSLKSLLMGRLRRPAKALTPTQRSILRANGFSQDFIYILEGRT